MSGVQNNSTTGLPAGAAFHESLASGWSSGYSGGGFRKRRQQLLHLLERRVRPGQDWLDLGCGSGVLSAELLRLGARVTAVDGSPAMLDAARAALCGDASVALLQSDVTDLAMLADDSCDGVLCSSVIEYLDAPDALLSEAARVLRPSGRLILSLPPTRSAVRSVQKIARRVFSLFGANRFAYLDVSRFEIAPERIHSWLGTFGLIADGVTGFDPLLGAGKGPLRPAVLIIDAHKKP